MKIFIAGALGDIGSVATHLALAEGHLVTAMDSKPKEEANSIDLSHSNLSYIQGDARDFDIVLAAMREAQCEGVINLAALRNPTDYLVQSHNTNVVISWNILRAAAELGISKVSQASSINIIGAIFNTKVELDYLPVDEDHPCRPDEPYGLSKQVLELQGAAIVRRFSSMRVSSFRPHWTLPQSQFHRPVAMTDKRASLQLWGWTEATACARAFLLGLTALRPEFTTGHEAFFIVSPRIGSNKPTEELLKEWWPDVPRKRTLTGIDGLYDCSKAERLLGWVHDLPA